MCELFLYGWESGLKELVAIHTCRRDGASDGDRPRVPSWPSGTTQIYQSIGWKKLTDY